MVGRLGRRFIRRVFALLMAAVLLYGIFYCGYDVFAGGDASLATSGSETEGGENTEETALPVMETEQIPDNVKEQIKADSVILIEQTTGVVLYEYNADSPRAPASITKIMTMLLIVEALDRGEITLEDSVTASEHACSMGGTQIWLEPGETMTVDELLRAMVIGSANDAAVALAEHIGESETGFVDMMNRRAAELGMLSTVFTNASGLDEEGHFTTARDIAIMGSELLKHEVITQYTTVWMDSLRDGETQLVNTNKLIRYYKGITGLKTGTTDDAGRCVAASAKREQMSVIAVVMGAHDRDAQFSSAKALLDYGFGSFTVTAPLAPENLTPVKVLCGTSDSVMPAFFPPENILLRKGQENNIVQTVELAEDLQAPVEQGQVIGKVVIYVNEEAVGEYPLVAAEEVPKINFFLAFGMLFSSVLCSVS